MFGESEKNGLELICQPHRFQVMRFTLKMTLNCYHEITHPVITQFNV
jgi:hypothetical protein